VPDPERPFIMDDRGHGTLGVNIVVYSQYQSYEGGRYRDAKTRRVAREPVAAFDLTVKLLPRCFIRDAQPP